MFLRIERHMLGDQKKVHRLEVGVWFPPNWFKYFPEDVQIQKEIAIVQQRRQINCNDFLQHPSSENLTFWRPCLTPTYICADIATMPNMNQCKFTAFPHITNTTITEGYKATASIRQDVPNFHTGAATLIYHMSTMEWKSATPLKWYGRQGLILWFPVQITSHYGAKKGGNKAAGSLARWAQICARTLATLRQGPPREKEVLFESEVSGKRPDLTERFRNAVWKFTGGGWRATPFQRIRAAQGPKRDLIMSTSQPHHQVPFTTSCQPHHQVVRNIYVVAVRLLHG